MQHKKTYKTLNIVNIYMNATKRIPVTDTIWQELSKLKKAGQTYDELLEELVEEHKKTRLFNEMRLIEESGDFVELD
jgi:predicted CopG family antitoxin